MSIINKLSSRIGKREEGPNIEVAKLCVQNPSYLDEIRDNLHSKDKKLQGDCAEVFTEVAKIKPDLAAKYIDDLLSMLDTKNNRALWESLASISLIAHLKANRIYPYREKFIHLAKTGSVIVVDGAVSTLGKVAAQSDEYNKEIFPKLLKILKGVIPRDIPRIAEYIIPAVMVNSIFKGQMRIVLEKRLPECVNKSAISRVRKLLKSLE